MDMHVQVDDSKLHNHEQISWQDGIMIHHNRDHLSNSNSDMADGSESWSLTGAGLRSEGTVELRGSLATNEVSRKASSTCYNTWCLGATGMW